MREKCLAERGCAGEYRRGAGGSRQKIDDGERLKQSFESRYLAEVQRRKLLEAALINERKTLKETENAMAYYTSAMSTKLGDEKAARAKLVAKGKVLMEKGKQSLHKDKEINELKQELEDTETQAEVKVQQLKIALQQKEQECKRRMKKLQLTLAARKWCWPRGD